MKIAIIGSRGIPNRYGGFEELAEHLSVALVKNGHEVAVFHPHHHPVKDSHFKGVQRISAYDPEWLKSAGQFVYDLISILKCWRLRPQVILQLGYTSSAIWFWLLPPKSKVITNMDGMEWQRSKYGWFTKKFLRLSEWLAVKSSHVLVADHAAILQYLNLHYLNQTVLIPYGATVPKNFDVALLQQYNLQPDGYFLVIARMEPENHIETIIEGYLLTNSPLPLVIIGNIANKHGKRWQNKYKHTQIRFVAGVYQKKQLHALRHFARWYVHGHSVGGTNPSLLEAMGCSANILAHDNAFNRGVLEKNAAFFSNSSEVATAFKQELDADTKKKWHKGNLSKIRTSYNWQVVTAQYTITFEQILLR
jgi:glycosyltransferase involved in cell wall biosynthesis